MIGFIVAGLIIAALARRLLLPEGKNRVALDAAAGPRRLGDRRSIAL